MGNSYGYGYSTRLMLPWERPIVHPLVSSNGFSSFRTIKWTGGVACCAGILFICYKIIRPRFLKGKVERISSRGSEEQ